MKGKTSLIKSTQAISAATLASRVLGFIRDVIIAKFFGTGAAAQAFVVAFRIPNLLRGIVGEGGTNACVVPVLSRLDEAGQTQEFWQVARSLLYILLILLAAITLLGELFAPYVVRAIAPGFIAAAEKLELTVRLSRFLFPYLLLIGLVAYATAVLNSLKVFALPALTPCMLNLSLIASALIFCPRLKVPVDGLAIGVLVGGLLQIVLQFPALVKKGLLRKGVTGFIHPKVQEIGRLFLPRILGMTVYQLNLFVDTIFASLALIVGEGAPAALAYANRIVQFPLALFGIALAQAALPRLSGLALRQDLDQLKQTVSFSLRSVFAIMVPATVGLMVLARPLVQIIFERGNFTGYSTDITAFVLVFYALGLSAYAGIKILANCFYALKDTLTPGKIAALALVVNIVLDLILMRPLKMGGLALATAVSVSVNFILLFFILRRRIGRLARFGQGLLKVFIASLVMGSAMWFLFYRCDFLLGNRLWPAAKLGVVLLIGAVLYAVALKLWAKEEARLFLGWISKRK